MFEVPSFLQDVGDGTSVDDRIEQMKLYFADKPQPEPQQSMPGSKKNTLHHLADNLLFAQFTGAGLMPLFSGHPGSPLENIAVFPRFNRTDHS